MILALEVDLYREPVCDRRPLGQTLQGAPHPARVQELPLSAVQLGRGGTEEAVQEGGELGAGEEAGAVLEVEKETVGRGPVQGEHQRPGMRGAAARGAGRGAVEGAGPGWLRYGM